MEILIGASGRVLTADARLVRLPVVASKSSVDDSDVPARASYQCAGCNVVIRHDLGRTATYTCMCPGERGRIVVREDGTVIRGRAIIVAATLAGPDVAGATWRHYQCEDCLEIFDLVRGQRAVHEC